MTTDAITTDETREARRSRIDTSHVARRAAIDAVRDIADRRSRLTELERRAVLNARLAGVGWETLGAALYLSENAVRYRYDEPYRVAQLRHQETVRRERGVRPRVTVPGQRTA
jgi:hypothetical protein